LTKKVTNQVQQNPLVIVVVLKLHVRHIQQRKRLIHDMESARNAPPLSARNAVVAKNAPPLSAGVKAAAGLTHHRED
jgi:hypothetical protein